MTPTEFFSEISTGQLLEIRQQGIKTYLNEDGTITAWTSITEQAFEVLQAQGYLTCPSALSEPDFADAYRWMVEMMAEVGLHAPADGLSPLWCWISHGTPDRKPNGQMLESGNYLVEFRIPSDLVLCSSFGAWHYCLNYWPIVRSCEASDAYERRLLELGLNFYRTKPLPSPHHEHIQASWRKIFKLDFHAEDEAPDPLENRQIQGAFWTLHKEYITCITKNL